MRWRRHLMAALLLAACGGEQAVTTTALPQAPTTMVTSPPAEAGGVPEPSEGEGADVAEVLESAPDFTLQLGDDTTFTLSEELRPLYLVFWAEW